MMSKTRKTLLGFRLGRAQAKGVAMAQQAGFVKGRPGGCLNARTMSFLGMGGDHHQREG